ncbi:MAG: phosphoribosylformylglycinamidine synthase subunit PurS [Alphaproteobacteria bacterium]|nr:phosphoribosylformylglycinamidine synthase subunit PurS [Alphaproteobacteria bacterium]
MKARVHVTLKPGVVDPEGAAIARSLGRLGFGGVEAVRVGKVFELALATSDTDAARAEVEAMCEKLLANPVIQSYRIELAD